MGSLTDKELSAEKKEEFEKSLKAGGPPKNNPPYDRFPADIQRARLWALAQPQRFTGDDDSYWGEEFAEIFPYWWRPGSVALRLGQWF